MRKRDIFTMGVCLGAAAICGCQAMKGQADMNKQEKEAYAMTMQQQCETYFRDPETGLIFTQLDRKTLKPVTDDYFKGMEVDNFYKITERTPAEVEMHENFGMCTGSYMTSEVLRYEQTGATEALANAARCLQGLKFAYDLGKQLEEGYFPKVYGRKFSKETSTDQVLYALWGMDTYYPYASEEEQRLIKTMITSMIRFWVKRDYRYHYFSYCPDDWQWPIMRFPALLLLADKYADGDPTFRKEYERLLPHTARPENCQLDNARKANRPNDYEIANQAWCTVNGADRITMDVMNYAILLKNDPNNPMAETWKAGIRLMWDEVKDSIDPDGRYYAMVLYDFKTGKARRTPGYAVDGTANHGAKSGWSTMVTRGAMLALEFCPELADEVLPKVRLVLEKLKFEDCSYYDEPERFAPGKRYLTGFLSGDSVTNWLWTYRLYERWCQKEQQK